jgi:hypothetical protein
MIEKMESELAKGREHSTVHSSNQAQFCESGSHRRWDSTLVFGRIRVEIGWSFASRKISPTLECPPGNRLGYNKLQIKRKPTPQDAIRAADFTQGYYALSRPDKPADDPIDRRSRREARPARSLPRDMQQIRAGVVLPECGEPLLLPSRQFFHGVTADAQF